jgi:crossover junction endodeoxyribonuclease RusA
MDFYPPDHRRRDDDGLIASMKSARDGIADALKIDDRRFITRAEVKDETHPFGRVMVSIEGIK